MHVRVAAAVCVASDVSDPWASDGDTPGSGEVFFYLVNAQNSCGSTLGEGSDGAPRGGFACN